MTIAFKVDIDTYEGMRDGVPKLLAIFDRHHIRATFFVTYGPDNSGKAALRVFTKRGFLKKMLRSNAVKMYGVTTALRGTLLPAPKVGCSFPDLVREIPRRGHEAGVHAWDHVYWHDRLPRMSEDEVRAEFKRACDAHTGILGAPPRSSAAAGWTCNDIALRVKDEWKLLYNSDTRGPAPFFPTSNGTRYALQIPTTLPTLDEALGAGMCTEAEADGFLFNQLVPDRLNVFTLHTEAEGRAYAGFFEKFIERLKASDATFLRLCQVADELLKSPDAILSLPLVQGTLPGRAGNVAVAADRSAEANACGSRQQTERSRRRSS